MLTSNRSRGKWGPVISDPVVVTAILDRQLHH
ncbi:ATP-binding protein [Bradyrhizobium brasilense]